MAEALLAAGGDAYEREDGLVIQGTGGDPLPGGGPIATHLDHRIAMSMAVAALSVEGVSHIDGWEAVATSYPAFADDLRRVTGERTD
jgi:3-phosphoshikimate 1-carboxyvinyltransferase